MRESQMQPRTASFRSLMLLGISFLLAGTAAESKGQSTQEFDEFAGPDWHQINQEMTTRLKKEDFKALMQNPGGKEKAEVLLKKFNLSIRAGDEKQAVALISELSKLSPPLSKHVQEAAADFLIGKENWSLSRYFLECFPHCTPGWGYVFVKEWLRQEGNSSKTQEKIDKWLESQAIASPRSNYWIQERMRFAQDCGKSLAFTAELQKKVIKCPSMKSAESFIAAADLLYEKPDYSFLPSAYLPDTAFEKFELASRLESRAPAVALKYLESSLKTPFSQKDKELVEKRLLRFSSPVFQFQDKEKLLRNWTRESLAEAYRKSGKMEEAQKLLLELSNQKQGMPSYALTRAAGQIQSQLPAKPLEKVIKKAEPENKNNQEYWLGRARYYQGRKEDTNVVAAFEKALSLSSSQTDNKVIAGQRRQAVDSYCHYLRNTSRADKAAALWFSEFQSSSKQFYRGAMLDSIWHADSHLLKADDERIWDYLSKEKVWDYRERHILQSMLESPEGVKNRERFWSCCQKLAEQDPSRQAALGFLMDRNGAASRAIPLLRAAVLAIKDKDKQALVRSNLFEAYLNNGNWKQAEQIWNSGDLALSAVEIPEWLVNIAVAAAKSGAKDDAFRLWKEKDRIDRSYLGSLKELSELGLRKRLIDYYQAMSKSNPSSTVPGQALKELR